MPGDPPAEPYMHYSKSRDRKSTRLNSSHGYISYAVFCLKKKKKHIAHISNNRKRTTKPLTYTIASIIKKLCFQSSPDPNSLHPSPSIEWYSNNIYMHEVD